VLGEFTDGSPERRFTDENHPVQKDSLIVRTNRSANALRFGDRRTTCTPAAANVSRNAKV
jgi:hypothetical protein